MGQQGAEPTAGWIAGLISAAPWLVSTRLLNTPGGRQILNNIRAGEQVITPMKLAAVTAAAKLFEQNPERVSHGP